jgi:formimidoylglutamate deiminase
LPVGLVWSCKGMPRPLTFEYVLTPSGLQHRCRVSCDDAGRIVAVEPGTADRTAGGLALPGMPNAHSHAFQRAIAGRGEGRTQDSFWSWRAVMYRIANAIDPEELYVIALRAFADMLRGGYTSVGEFHYVHHRRDGSKGADMALAVREAARAAGIRLVMLPVLYQRGGFGREPAPDQQRFVHRTLDEFGRLLEVLRGEPCGVAPHSLRAVELAVLPEVVALADSILGRDAPIHIHVSEQRREVDECRALHGSPPIECLADTIELGPRWSLVHATHAEPAEVDLVKERDPNLVLCPLTEAYLGDGMFPLQLLGEARFAIGSDSNVRIDAIEELRLAEYGQRLAHQRRVALAGADDVGGSLWRRAAQIGARSIAQPVGALAPGSLADLTVLNLGDPLFAGLPVENVLDAWITGGSAAQIESVYVGGQRRVERGEMVGVVGLERFADVMARIHSETRA